MRLATADVALSAIGAGARTFSLAPIERIALIGNALPRLCCDLHQPCSRRTARAFPTGRGRPLCDGRPWCCLPLPRNVTGTIAQEDRASYRDAARVIEGSAPDLIWVQHDFGIFGGPAGSYLIDLLDRTSTPVVATLHTVLDAPNPDQRRVMELVYLCEFL